ncbi:MAG TPA: acetyl-CoA carboxylase biotin carboxyl carrier protein subunit [Candidatus Brocadiales bacterium]|nr:acetyl-CoA carboxylase biotin carboxyl carrier protein subunit [Candidatus Brocadiales bacterium]
MLVEEEQVGQTFLSVLNISIAGQSYKVRVSNEIYRLIIPPRPPLVKRGLRGVPERIKVVICPMPGIVTAVGVKDGDKVKKGDSLLIVEAMKMENEIKAPCSGVIKQINVTQGSMVKLNDELIIMG